MAANTIQLNVSNPVAGLGTSSFNIVDAGEYTLEVKTTIPLDSAVQILLKQQGSTIVTAGGVATDPTPTQQSIGAVMTVQCAAADLLQVVISSANAVDSIPNNVKSIVNLYRNQ